MLRTPYITLALLVLGLFVWPMIRYTVAQRAVVNIFSEAMIAPSANDIVFAGDRDAIKAIAKRLRSMTATPEEITANNDAVNVAIIESLPEATSTPGKVTPQPRITVNLASAGHGAVVIVAPAPALYLVENGGDKMGKIVVEGQGAFDLENAPSSLLAGYSSEAFQGKSAGGAEPRDYLARDGMKSRFCAAMERWRAAYDVRASAMKIYIFNRPSRIDVFPTGLSGSPNPQSSATWTVALACQRDPFIAHGGSRGGDYDFR